MAHAGCLAASWCEGATAGLGVQCLLGVVVLPLAVRWVPPRGAIKCILSA